MFVAALFRIARTWKESRCSVTGEWIKKLYIYTMEYYSPIKRNTSESVLMRWMNLEPIILYELRKRKGVAHPLPAPSITRAQSRWSVGGSGWEQRSLHRALIPGCATDSVRWQILYIYACIWILERWYQ